MTTFPRLLERLAAASPHRTALQEKRYGIWQPITWAEYRQRVRDFAHGLAELDVRRGDVVAVLGDNRPEWLISELATQCLGAAVVGIYPTSIGEEIVHILGLAEVTTVIAEDQEQVDKLIRLADQLPALAHVIYYDPHGLEHYDQPYLRKFTDVEAAGRAYGTTREGWLDQQIAAGTPDDVAVICTTSGTTARPKLAQLSHANLLSMAEHLTAVDPIEPGYRFVSFLPLAWIGEQMIGVACGLSAGLTLSFPEDAATVRADLREIGPDVMFSPPRIWESMLSEVQVRIDEAGWLKRTVFGRAYAVGDRYAGRRVRGERIGPGLALLHRLADAVGLRPVRDQLGLARLRRGYTGGAPLSPDVFRFFQAIGVNLKQIYGQTEICGIAVLHRDDDVRFATVGAPIPGTELTIAADGEILLRSASVLRGYLRNEQATRKAVDAEGWLRTGDAGYVEDGHLVVIDRQADVLTLGDGSRFSAAFIENKLKFSPYVAEAVTFHSAADTRTGTGEAEAGETGEAEAAGGAGGAGASAGGITAIVCIDPATVGAWAERQHLGYTTYTDLAAKPETARLVAEDVWRANQDLPEPIRVRRFVLLHKQLDPDDDEITRTRKVKRNVVAERYATIITALEQGADSVEVKTTVTYQDGSRADRLIPLRIIDLAGFTPIVGRRRPVWSGRA